jgi:hypothetical protein
MSKNKAFWWCLGFNIFYFLSSIFALLVGDRIGFQGAVTRSVVMTAAGLIILAMRE